MKSLISLAYISFITLAIFMIYIIMYRKTQKVKKRSYRDEKIAYKNGDSK